MKKYRLQKEYWDNGQLINWKNSYFRTNNERDAYDLAKIAVRENKRISKKYRTKLFEAETGLQIFPHRNEEKFMEYILVINGKKEVYRGLKLNEAKRHAFAKYPFLEKDNSATLEIITPDKTAFVLSKDFRDYNRLNRK